MDELAKSEELGDLYAFYGPLLTQGQRDYFEDYYYDDLSLGEIAANHHVSRAAVYDSLRRSSKALEKYEAELGLKKQNDWLLRELGAVLTLIKTGQAAAAQKKLAKVRQKLA